jgi:small subunit ribosomal protein S6
MYIVDPTLDEAELQSVIDHMEAAVRDAGGEIKGHYDWGRRRLMYKIRRLTEGLYRLLYFQATGDIVDDVKHHALGDERVIRLMIVVASPNAIYQPPGEGAQEPQPTVQDNPEHTPGPEPVGGEVQQDFAHGKRQRQMHEGEDDEDE